VWRISVFDEDGRSLPFEHLPVSGLASAIAYIDVFMEELPEWRWLTIADESLSRTYCSQCVNSYHYLGLDWTDAHRT